MNSLRIVDQRCLAIIVKALAPVGSSKHARESDSLLSIGIRRLILPTELMKFVLPTSFLDGDAPAYIDSR